MTITPVQQSPDTATVERLAVGFNRSFETCEDPDEVLSPDVFFDLYPPFWRFQLQGRDAIQEQLRKISEGCEVTSRILRVVPTADGFLMEHEETSARRADRGGPQAVALRRARRPDRRGDLLLQRRMGRRAAGSPRRRSADAAALKEQR